MESLLVLFSCDKAVVVLSEPLKYPKFSFKTPKSLNPEPGVPILRGFKEITGRTTCDHISPLCRTSLSFGDYVIEGAASVATAVCASMTPRVKNVLTESFASRAFLKARELEK